MPDPNKRELSERDICTKYTPVAIIQAFGGRPQWIAAMRNFKSKLYEAAS